MAVVVGVVRQRDVETVLHRDQAAPSRTATSSPCGSCRPNRRVMKRKVGSTRVVHDRERRCRTARRSAPVVRRPRRRADRRRAELRAADGVEVDHACRDRRRTDRCKSWRCVVGARRRARVAGCAARRAGRRARSALARVSIQPVTCVSAGPPCGGLYLKPPSSGGLCDGVMTMPSARPDGAAAVVVEDGVRDGRRRRVAASRSIMTSTPFAASTSSALTNGRLRQRVRVDAEEQRPVDALRRR